MVNNLLAHANEATSSTMLEHMEEETGREFTHFMGDMMGFNWGGWSSFYIILWWLIWILIIIALVALIRWLWLKGGQDEKNEPKR